MCIRDSPDIVPHGEEHHRQVPHRVPFQDNGGILPVTVFFIGVDILIRQIDAAGEAGVPVDYADFPVIPVIEPGGKDGNCLLYTSMLLFCCILRSNMLQYCGI